MNEFDLTEQETRSKFIFPQLCQSGWDTPPYSIAEEKTFTDGRIVVIEGLAHRGKPKKADYILRLRPDMSIAVVEAKRYRRNKADGLQQAKNYAEILDLKFAYSSNGRGIIEFDFITGLHSELDAFPSPEELWQRLKLHGNVDNFTEKYLLEPSRYVGNKRPRYYQEIAVNRIVQAISKGNRRLLLTMATGTGKTFVAFQICWKLWRSRWNMSGSYRRPRILFLADRSVLVDDPKDKTFLPFGDARHKIEGGEANKSREIYFATYQAIAEDERHPGLYKEYAPDFFDLIIVDEAHRGSAQDDSNWRSILEYFLPAYQLGLTATPLREENRNTYEYFGNPIFQYSLRQGIEDGFLSPYTVHRVVTDVDATGWRPEHGQLDRFEREIPDKEYWTPDFEKELVLQARTCAIAGHIAGFMQKSGRYAKTIVFCVNQEHALEMKQELNNLNADLVRDTPNYVVRITADEGQIGRGFLSQFQEPDTDSPIVVTTSKLLTTGVDVPTCKNIVIARVVRSMTEFKQIIGRGTRVRDDYDKLFFNILDYTGSATKHFADPEFDGYPAQITEIHINSDGEIVSEQTLEDRDPEAPDILEYLPADPGHPLLQRRKYYVDDVQVEIAAEMVYFLDADGNQRMMKFIDYTAEQVRTLYPNSAAMRQDWKHPEKRNEIIASLEELGITFERLAIVTDQPSADPFDLLCHIAFNAPIRSRRERATRVVKEEQVFFEKYAPEARAILNELLEKYATHGVNQFALPDVLELAPISDYGNITEIAGIFGDANTLREAVQELQTLLYAA